MRNIYTDEAGTSAPEPVTLVVALLLHADTQYSPVVQELVRLFWQVPKQYREGFSFHAKTLYAKNKYPNWDYEERKALMRSVMGLPGAFRIPVAVGAVKRGRLDKSLWPDKKMTPAMADHFFAFTLCMAAADGFLRNHCGPEMGQVIAEDLPQMKSFLQRSLDLLRTRPAGVTRVLNFRGTARLADGTETLRVERIVDEVHFMTKHRAPFLQIADACAFGLRRLYAGGEGGMEFFEAILGKDREGWILPDFNSYAAVYFKGDAGGKPLHPFSPGQSS